MNDTLTLNHIETAVAPLREAAMARAEEAATTQVARATKMIEDANHDLDAVAPRPDSLRTDRKTYRTMTARRCFFLGLCTLREVSGIGAHRWQERLAYGDVDEAKVAAYVAMVRRDAALAFDAFVAKLTAKVGDGVVAASLTTASGLWSHSVITVHHADGTVARWKTQQILNVSGLGTVFNQWPTRKVVR